MGRDRESRHASLLKSSPVPTVLIVAGSDSSCGAGVSADLETVRGMGCRPLLAVTSVTAQTDETFLVSHPIPPLVLRAQLEASFQQAGDGIVAVKVGMLPDETSVETVSEFLERRDLPNIVIDPVLASTSRGPLAKEAGFSIMCRRLFPLATLVTPNVPEACRLTGLPCKGEKDLPALAKAILGCGSTAVLMKGGHLLGEECIDYLLQKNDSRGREFRQPRLPGGPFRGTGCRLASAIASRLALDDDLGQAVETARTHLLNQLRDAR